MQYRQSSLASQLAYSPLSPYTSHIGSFELSDVALRLSPIAQPEEILLSCHATAMDRGTTTRTRIWSMGARTSCCHPNYTSFIGKYCHGFVAYTTRSLMESAWKAGGETEIPLT